jgi:hypothetical protein
MSTHITRKGEVGQAGNGGQFAKMGFSEAEDSVGFDAPYNGTTATQQERIERMLASVDALKTDARTVHLEYLGDSHSITAIDGIPFENATDREVDAAQDLQMAYGDYIGEHAEEQGIDDDSTPVSTEFSTENKGGDAVLDVQMLRDQARGQRKSASTPVINDDVEELVTNSSRRSARRTRTAIARTESTRAQQEDMRDIADGVRARYPQAASVSFVMHHDEDGPTLRPSRVVDADGSTLASTMYGAGGEEMPDQMYEDIDDRIAEVNAQELMDHPYLRRAGEADDPYGSYEYELGLAQVDATPIDQSVEKMDNGHEIDHVLASVPMSADHVQPKWNARTRSLDAVEATMSNGQRKTLTVEEYPHLKPMLDGRTQEALDRGEGASAWSRP